MPTSKRLTEDQRFFSKKLPLAQAKKENVDQIVESLSQHPLIMYSHFEDTLPADVIFNFLYF
jgi:hypothetical protein